MIKRQKSLFLDGKTILLGNGLNLCFNHGCSWKEIFGGDNSVPFYLKHRNIKKFNIEKICDDLDKSTNISEEYINYVHTLIELGFTNFLTTNFTYEIEYSLLILDPSLSDIFLSNA